jgi:hypothetical protein
MTLVERVAGPGELERTASVLLEQLLHVRLARRPRRRHADLVTHTSPFLSWSSLPAADIGRCAMVVIRYAQRHGTRGPWLVQLLARRTTQIAAVVPADQPPNRSTSTP